MREWSCKISECIKVLDHYLACDSLLLLYRLGPKYPSINALPGYGDPLDTQISIKSFAQ